VERNEEHDAQAADTVQDPGQHWPFALVSQTFNQANVPF
jgi:hypothetical protein